MSGYNIDCDPGDLYSRKCYVTNPSTGKREEIIGYDSAGNPLSKGETTAAGTAWQINVTALNQDGTAYSPYGSGGVPWTLGGGIAGIGAIMPSSGADLQDWKYITESAPGSQARKTYQQRVCNPLWPTFGCRQAPLDSDLIAAPTAAASQPSVDYADRSVGEKIIGWWKNLLGQ
jgi:hypothetical protein